MTDIESAAPDAPSLGLLVAALAKAQTQFTTVTRDKTVVVQTKTGATYTFKYAPLDTILAAVRGPLSKNGLVLVQTLDDGALVTSLLHESGASISGRMALPSTNDIQGLGSAITYLRRYAIQAVLGIAAEEDDDGNRAAGNETRVPAPEQRDDGGLVGTVEVGKTKDSDYELRETPEGWALGFRLKSGRGGIKVVAKDAAALALAANKEETVGQRVICWGHVRDETWTPKNSTRKVTYQVLDLERIQAPSFVFPALPVTPEPETAEAPSGELFDDDKLDPEERLLVGQGLPE
jgi:hypothetical protein